MYDQAALLSAGRGSIVDGSLVPKGYVKITGISSAMGLGAIPDGASLALIIPETQAIRYRDDGTSPTATTGMPLPAGLPFPYSGKLDAFEVIEQASGAIVNVSFYG